MVILLANLQDEKFFGCAIRLSGLVEIGKRLLRLSLVEQDFPKECVIRSVRSPREHSLREPHLAAISPDLNERSFEHVDEYIRTAVKKMRI